MLTSFIIFLMLGRTEEPLVTNRYSIFLIVHVVDDRVFFFIGKVRRFQFYLNLRLFITVICHSINWKLPAWVRAGIAVVIASIHRAPNENVGTSRPVIRIGDGQCLSKVRLHMSVVNLSESSSIIGTDCNFGCFFIQRPICHSFIVFFRAESHVDNAIWIEIHSMRSDIQIASIVRSMGDLVHACHIVTILGAHHKDVSIRTILVCLKLRTVCTNLGVICTDCKRCDDFKFITRIARSRESFAPSPRILCQIKSENWSLLSTFLFKILILSHTTNEERVEPFWRRQGLHVGLFVLSLCTYQSRQL